MAQRQTIGVCWGEIHRTGWDGIRHAIMATCEKRPRQGCLTCWWHRSQERQAQRLQAEQPRPPRNEH